MSPKPPAYHNMTIQHRINAAKATKGIAAKQASYIEKYGKPITLKPFPWDKKQPDKTR